MNEMSKTLNELNQKLEKEINDAFDELVKMMNDRRNELVSLKSEQIKLDMGPDDRTAWCLRRISVFQN